ncbi:M24 family metallopeptidase [Edaphobacter dinghuensis]|uniref:Aminopeptidase n=1 Tax=Edaphobacter dinghuensis TaxID=1560005 RepID=A0A917LYX4_9BACT|nr:M24 family metallopeptidase [Edaphobacter dinghuensis]GGG66241.1 aminopeptidase [Edaphobacter dinghuensis]
MTEPEQVRTEELLRAQHNAKRLFEEVEARGLIRAGITEAALNAEIYALAQEMFGITTYWHKRIVRAGKNTLVPYAENPPDLTLGEDDILFLDLGPVFEQWEADFGRTFVLGSDPIKHKLRHDVGEAFAAGKRYFEQHPDLRANELFQYAVELAQSFGWEFGGPIAGHLIGQFPHERIPEDKISLYVHPKNSLRMREPGTDGEPRHWILEIHFVDRARQIGGFYEELLTL